MMVVQISKNRSAKTILLVLSLVLIFMVVNVGTLFASQSNPDSTVFVRQDSIVSHISQKSEMDNYFFRVIWVTFFILALIIIGFYVYRKSMGRFVASGKNKIKVVARYSLGPKQMLLVVHVEGQKLMLGVTENGISLLKDFGPASADEEEIEMPQSLSASFGSILNKLKKER